MLNGSPLNAQPLNGANAALDPIYVVAGQSFVWTLRLLVAGAGVTAQLTGAVEVDREEGAAGVAGFVLFLAPGSPVVPADWIGRAVSLDYISTTAGETTEVRRFTGQISSTTWDPITRLLDCECSDQLQYRVEGMTIAAIDSLVGGYWSADLFDPTVGRSHWDYALERMSTRAASLDCSPSGALRVTSWYGTQPHFVFGPGTTIYQSVELQLAELGNITNRVEIEVSYRYQRLQQLIEGYSWQHPHTGDTGGVGGFCSWRTWSTELPDTAMFEDALTGAGLTMTGQVGGYKLPLSMTDPCGDGIAWINTYDNLWLSASVTGGRRWTQSVTETYTLTLTTAEGEVIGTQRISRDSASIEVQSTRADEWSGSLETEPHADPGDLTDEARRVAAIECLLHRGQTEIIAAHRGTTLSWSVPSSLALTIDLTHTLSLDDQGARAIGKCRRISDSFDLASGHAITTLSIAVMRGGGISEPLTVPAAPDTSLPELSGKGGSLPTQLGGRQFDPYTGFAIGPYDESRMGFAGNYSVNDNEPAEHYPRRFDLEAREIPAEYRDERTATAEATYLVGIPNDLLEL
jgi:hypothetical protein